MKKLTLITLYLLFLSTCGLEGSHKDLGQSSLSQELAITGSYDDLEKAVALRICYAFRSKNTNFRVAFLEKDFVFKIEEKTCDGANFNENFTGRLKAPYSNEPMFFDALTSTDYYKHLQTDTDGVLRNICRSFLSGQTPKKVQTNGSELNEISFFNNGSDSFKLSTAFERDNKFIIETEEIFSVDTAGSSDYLGLVTAVQKEQVCSNSQTSSFIQTSTTRPSKN